LYWFIAALSHVGLVEIPSASIYANHERPDVVAWNGSFLPIDLTFAYFGLRSVAAERRGDERWRGFAIVSLTLTMAAGAMAVSYWTLSGEFDPIWFVSHALLVIWPIFFLPALLSGREPKPHSLFDRYLDAHASNDLEAVLSLFAEDATLEDPVGSPTIRGADAIRAFYSETHQANGPLVIERVGSVLEGGTERAAHVRARFASQPTSAGMDVIYSIQLDDDEKIVSLRAFY
jgi:ketosteroid isomerase-like protein